MLEMKDKLWINEDIDTLLNFFKEHENKEFIVKEKFQEYRVDGIESIEMIKKGEYKIAFNNKDKILGEIFPFKIFIEENKMKIPTAKKIKKMLIKEDNELYTTYLVKYAKNDSYLDSVTIIRIGSLDFLACLNIFNKSNLIEKERYEDYLDLF